MAGYKAQDYGTVNYNFKPDVPVEGKIPDPSDEMIQDYFKEIKEYYTRHGLDDIPSDFEMRTNPERLQEMIDKMQNSDRISLNRELVGIVCRLCGGQPSEDEVLGLPFRKRVKFLQFVQKELTNPE